MLKKIQSKIRKYRDVKYQKIVFSKSDVILRKKIMEFLSKKADIKTNKSITCTSCNFFSKYLNKNNFIHFYKKFNSKLQLKEKYNIKTFKKVSDKNACLKSYLIFGEALKKNNKINNIQKLNTILKLNDLLILMYSNYKCSSHHKDVLKMFELEKKLLKLYL